MKSKTFLFAIIFLLFAGHLFSQDELKYKTGDIIFQTTHTKAARAIELATHSKFSHVGIIINDNRKLFVLEAVQPVSITPFNEFVNRGDKKYYEVKRLKNDSGISSRTEKAIIEKAKSLTGINYDYAFCWDDRELYCSELVYKIYHYCPTKLVTKI